MATRQALALPNELWTRVLQNLDNDEDRPELWMIGRHICTTFKHEVESIFRDTALPKTMLIFNLGLGPTAFFKPVLTIV